MAIIYEPHSTSYDNEKGIASGHLDSPLSPLGLKQAEQLGARYSMEEIGAVLCSDLSRSHETAKVAFQEKDVLIIPDKRIREWNYGMMNGQPAKAVEEQKRFHISEPFPQGESLVLAVGRILACIQDVLSSYPGKTIVIIGHRAAFYALEHKYRHIPLEKTVLKPWKWQPGWRYP